MFGKRILYSIILGLLIVLSSITLYVFVDTTGNNPVNEKINANVTTSPTTPESTSSPSISDSKHSTVKISAVGDILLGRGVEYHLKQKGKSFSYPFAEIKKTLEYGDIIFGNLEEPFTSRTKSLTGLENGGKIILKSKPEAIKGIEYAGFNLLSLANNHILDYYTQGLYDTIDLLKSKNILFAGAGKNLSMARSIAIDDNKEGVKTGLLAYTEMAYNYYGGNPSIKFAADKSNGGVAPYNLKDILDDIKRAKDDVDILMISLHFGTEYSPAPSAKQISDVHKMIDAGADVILGHHTHRSQGIEIYKGKPVIYSMGNFLFDQNDPLNQRSFVINMEMTDDKLTELTAVPIMTIDKCRIVKATGNAADEMLRNHKKLCEALGSKCIIKNGRLIIHPSFQ